VHSFNVGMQLQQAVEKSRNQKWKVELSTAISADNARRIDVKYHLSCWVKNVQCSVKTCSENEDHTLDEKNIGIVASDIEFVSLVLNMTNLKSTYSDNGVRNILPTTHLIKEKISFHIDDVHFMKAKCHSESDQIFSTAVRDAAMEGARLKTTESSIRQLFDSASILQGAIADKNPWIFERELNTDDAEKHVPKALYAFIRRLMEGPATSITTEMVRSATIHRDVLTISQNIMCCY